MLSLLPKTTPIFPSQLSTIFVKQILSKAPYKRRLLVGTFIPNILLIFFMSLEQFIGYCCNV